MARKTEDPRKIALLDKLTRSRADFERWYARLKRAFTRLEKTRQRIVRLQRQLDRIDEEQRNGTATAKRSTP